MNVAVIGASDKPDRYSYKAVKMLKEKGYHVFPVHQRIKTIDGHPVYPSLDVIKESIDVISLYVSADISTHMARSIINKTPQKIIFNPGAENAELEELASDHGIVSVRACTLVLLSTGQFS